MNRPSPPRSLDLWALAGQSNMQGHGFLTEHRAHPAIWNFSSNGTWEPAIDPLHRLWESYTPVNQRLMREGLAEGHPDGRASDQELAERERIHAVSGAGLGLSFAEATLPHSRGAVGLIPAAHGGTSIGDWRPDDRGAHGDSLYGSLLLRIETALRQPGAELRGILWYQGESDTFADRAPDYEVSTISLIDRLRADLRMPDLLVVMVQVGRFVPNREHLRAGHTAEAWTTVRESQRHISETVPDVALTSAIDLSLCDEVHIDTSSLVRLGRRAARVASGRVGPRLQEITRSSPLPNERPTIVATFAHVTGGWSAQSAITGFTITTADGTPHPDCSVVDVAAAPENPSALRLTVTSDREDIYLAYGTGFDPSARLADSDDDPLPAFGPQHVN